MAYLLIFDDFNGSEFQDSGFGTTPPSTRENKEHPHETIRKDISKTQSTRVAGHYDHYGHGRTSNNRRFIQTGSGCRTAHCRWRIRRKAGNSHSRGECDHQ
ncbi:hypothetical protein DESC_90018 [Desulfosarcina cetonica]|nr:hypothetical protein DESC_90018 [Desulfosarcina cetonica]